MYQVGDVVRTPGSKLELISVGDEPNYLNEQVFFVKRTIITIPYKGRVSFLVATSDWLDEISGKNVILDSDDGE